MQRTRIALGLLVLVAGIASPQTIVNGRPSVVLASSTAQVVVDIGGGSIVDFHLQEQNLNPLTWGQQEAGTESRAMGHFLCFDRWGPPSEAERQNGMTFHGEAAQVEWSILQRPATATGTVQAEMEASLPMAGLTLTRRMDLSDAVALLKVSETVRNDNKLGRIYNLVQHATIGPPFLDETTVVDANARKGFMQSSPMPNPEEPSVYWPQALKDGQPVNLRHLTDDPAPGVVSYTIEDNFGWATAYTASKGLLIGYIWQSADYPWFNVWRAVTNGKPTARGLEFGTTGLHQPFPILVEKGRIFGRPIYDYLDAGETVTRSYAAFLFTIPADFRGVDQVTYRDGRLMVRERGGGDRRNLVMDVGELFPAVVPAP